MTAEDVDSADLECRAYSEGRHSEGCRSNEKVFVEMYTTYVHAQYYPYRALRRWGQLRDEKTTHLDVPHPSTAELRSMCNVNQ